MTSVHDDGLLPVVRAADLADMPEQSRWLIESLWTRAGVGILGGAPKCCKSWLALDLAVSVASQTPCLDRFAVADPGSVLIYMAEDATDVIKQRLLGICRHRSLQIASLDVQVVTASAIRLDQSRDQHRLRHTVAKLKPRLLILDPLVRLHRCDENDAGQISALLTYLRQLQREHDVAVLLVHHARKQGAGSDRIAHGQRLRGSGDLHAWGDSNLYLHRRRDQLALAIEHRSAATPAPLILTLDAAVPEAVHLRIDPGAQHDGPTCRERTDLASTVTTTLEQARQPMSRSALRAALRIRNERLGPVLADLIKQGVVLRVGQYFQHTAVPVPVPGNP